MLLKHVYLCRRESCDGRISASCGKTEKSRFTPAFQVISRTVVVHRKEQYNLNNWPALLLGLWKIKNMGTPPTVISTFRTNRVYLEETQEFPAVSDNPKWGFVTFYFSRW